MTNIRALLSVMRKFTAGGQEEVLNILKQNRAFMKERDFAFAELPKILSNQGKTKEVEQQLINPSESVRDIVVNLINRTRKNVEFNPEDVWDALLHAGENVQPSEVKILSNNFVSKRDAVLSLLKPELKNFKKFDLHIDNIETPSDMHQALVNIFAMHINLFQEGKRFKALKMNNMYLKAITAVAEKSSNPKIKRIESILKKKYGIKQVLLEDEECAVNMYKAVRIAKENDIPLPDNIVVSSAVFRPFNIFHSDNTRTIVLRPAKTNKESVQMFEKALEQYSGKKYPIEYRLINELTKSPTNNDIDTYLHELIHMEATMEGLFEELPNELKELLTNYVYMPNNKGILKKK